MSSLLQQFSEAIYYSPTLAKSCKLPIVDDELVDQVIEKYCSKKLCK